MWGTYLKASPLVVLAIIVVRQERGGSRLCPLRTPTWGLYPLDHRPVKEEANAKSRADGYGDGHISEVCWKLSLLLHPLLCSL
jgi:hypothetical protein